MDVAREGFLEGRNHPADIDGMISLFVRFNNVSYIRKAITIWGDAQPVALQLCPCRKNCAKGYILRTVYGQNKRTSCLHLHNKRKAHGIQGSSFPYTLGEGSRWLERVVLRLLFATALTVETTGLLLVISVSRGIQKGLTAYHSSSELVFRGRAKRACQSIIARRNRARCEFIQ